MVVCCGTYLVLCLSTWKRGEHGASVCFLCKPITKWYKSKPGKDLKRSCSSLWMAELSIFRVYHHTYNLFLKTSEGFHSASRIPIGMFQGGKKCLCYLT